MTRERILQSVRSQPAFDVLVIGGGINGVGTFRDLAMQGVRVLLVERGDFCEGASAASSHMLHGGIRYLENGEFRLVREALHERNLLLKYAPHYAKPLPTAIPIFRWFSGLLNAPFKFLGLSEKTAERGALVIKIGLIFYDLFTGPQQTMPRHSFSRRSTALRNFPRLNPDIRFLAQYYDAWMPNPERLTLELIMDAEAASDQAFALNYVSASGAAGDSVQLTDEMTGETFNVQPRVVINAAGPWIDFVNRAMQQETRFIGGTKGSHLVLDNPDLLEAAQGHEMFFENEDGRIVLILPFHDRVMIGTTDIRIENPDEVECTEDEIEYMLGMVRRVFPDIEVKRSQIVYKFTGVRPLPASEAGSTGTISRDHSIRTTSPGELKFPIHSLIGGKWTTFRAFSEQATDKALADLNRHRQISTAELLIGGGRNWPADETSREHWIQEQHQVTGLASEQLAVLLDRYGTYAAQVAAYMSEGDDVPLQHAPEYTRREIAFLIRNERVQHLDDLVMRRTLIAMLGRLTPELIDELVTITAAELNWNADDIAQEKAHTLRLVQHRHDLQPEDV